MPYSNALKTLSAWFCQLWAESLGKRKDLGGKDVYTGPTPVGAVGVTDQHSVMQLFQDGTFDKLVTLIEVDTLRDGDQAICPRQPVPRTFMTASFAANRPAMCGTGFFFRRQ